MSIPANPYSEADAAESQRKTFKGIGCAAGALAFPAPFIFGFPGGFGMVPVLVIIGLVFMFLAIAAKSRRDRIVWAVAHQRVEAAPPVMRDVKPISLPPLDANPILEQPNTAKPAATKQDESIDPEVKLNQRLNKAKKAGL